MISLPIRRLFSFFALFSLISTAIWAREPAANETQQRPVRTPAWNSETSNLPVDKSIIYGRLPNGLRYAIRPNDRPQNKVLVRMVVDFGSAAENDDEQGLAHFIEHMVFNGTTHVPEGEMVKTLERLGLAFGADTNASTGYTKTEYKLNLPKADPKLIERALFLMRETASEVKFDPDAVDRERGVVIAEQRQRENFGFQSTRAANDLFYPNSYFSNRYPIGQKTILETAPPSRMKALYEKWYRPDRTRIIIVGPVDTDSVEREIARKFSDWENGAPPLDDFDQCQLDPFRPGEARIFEHPEISETLNIMQIVPDGERPDTFDRALIEWKMQIAGAILSDRISRRARSQDIPYLGSSPSFAIGFCDKYARIGMRIFGKDGSWRELMPIAEQLLRQAQIYGFTEQEIGEQIKRLNTAYDNIAKGEHTKSSNGFANELAGLDGDVITDAANKNLLWIQARPFMTKEAVGAEFNHWFDQLNQPLIHLTTKDAGGIDVQELTTAFEHSRATPLTPPEHRDAPIFAYDNFGPAGEILADDMIEDLGIRTIRFANGVMLNLKHTDFEDNRVRFSLRIDGGKLTFGRENAELSEFMASTFAAGGLSAHNIDDLRSIFAGTTVRTIFDVGDDYFGGYGAVAPTDLDQQLRLLAAYVLHPGYHEDALRQFRRPLPEFYNQLDATPQSAASVAISKIMNGDDHRFSLAPIETMQMLDFDELKLALGTALLENRLEIGLVGDFDEDIAIRSVAQTFGALPPRKTAQQDDTAQRQTKWSGNSGVHIIGHRGEENQLSWTRRWITTDDSDHRLEQVMNLLARIVTIQTIDELREKLGATYGANATSIMSSTYPGRGIFSIGTNGDPKDVDIIETTVDEIITKLTLAPIDADIFERARKPVLEGYADWRRNNTTWSAVTALAQTKPDRLERFRRSEMQFKSITPDDVWHAAQRFLQDKESYIFRSVPVRLAPEISGSNN